MVGGNGSLGCKVWEPYGGMACLQFGYVYGEGSVVAVVGVESCDGSVHGLEMCCGRKA